MQPALVSGAGDPAAEATATRDWVIRENALKAPLGVFFLLRRGQEFGAVRILRTTWDYGAVYEWYYQGDGSGDFLSENAQQGTGKVFERYKTVRWTEDSHEIKGVGSRTAIECGPLRLGWSTSNWIYFEDDVLIASTDDRSIGEVNALDLQLEWHGRKPWTLRTQEPLSEKEIDRLLDTMFNAAEVTQRVGATHEVSMGTLTACSVPRVVAALVEALDDEARVVRQAACMALAHLGPAAGEATPTLIKLLEGGDPQMRDLACRALGSIYEGTGARLEALERLAQRRDTVGSLAAHLALWKITDELEPHVHALSAALKGSAVERRATAAMLLREMGPAAHDAIPDLLEAAAGENIAVAGWCAMALGKLDAPAEQAVPVLQALALRQGAGSEAVLARRLAIGALGTFADRDAAARAALAEIAEVGTPADRWYAIQSLYGSDSATPPGLSAAIRQLFLGADSDTRESILLLVRDGYGPSEVAAKALVRGLSDGSEQVRWRSVMRLARLPVATEEAGEALVGAMEDRSREVRVRAATALGYEEFRFLGKRSVQALISGLQDEDPNVARAAIISLGTLGSQAQEAAPHLANLRRRLAKDPSRWNEVLGPYDDSVQLIDDALRSIRE